MEIINSDKKVESIDKDNVVITSNAMQKFNLNEIQETINMINYNIDKLDKEYNLKKSKMLEDLVFFNKVIDDSKKIEVK